MVSCRCGTSHCPKTPPRKNRSKRGVPQLLLSIPLTYDTVYGGSWSPDGKLIAVGCGDNTLRAFDAQTGEQILFQGAHADWVLETVFSVDGSHLISVSRDMTAKLTEVATERFVDNITSITPGALKGGIHAVARHPQRDEIVIGGSDGVPKVYRVFRQTDRKIGDDANLIRRLPPLKGRVFSVAVSADGKRIAAGSSLDMSGQIAIDGYEFDTKLPDDIKKIMSKVVTSRSADEKKRLEQFVQEGTRRIALVDVPAAVYCVAFLPDGKRLAAAGSDGMIRILNVERAEIQHQFSAIPSLSDAVVQTDDQRNLPAQAVSNEPRESLADSVQVASLSVEPNAIALSGRFDYQQLLVTATLSTDEQLDATRMVAVQCTDGVAVSSRGIVTPRQDGASSIALSLGGQTLTVPVSVTGFTEPGPPDFTTRHCTGDHQNGLQSRHLPWRSSGQERV